METILKTDKKLVFSAAMNESLANAIRRHVGEIPTMAVDEMEIEKNDSALYDETFAHRVGLLPLKMPKDAKEDTVIKLKIKKTGPGYIYSGDIKGDAEVVYDNIPLTLLKEGQEVKATCITKVGKGFNHAKFSPGLMFYRNLSEITLPKKYKENIESAFPDNKIKEKGDKISIKDDKPRTIIDFCQGLCQKDSEECEVKDSNNLIITIEPFGQISSEDIFKKAIEALKSNLKDLTKSL